MRILVCMPAYRYGDPASIDPHVEWFVDVPKRMGHTARLFNFSAWHPVDRDWLNDRFLEVLKEGAYDLTLVISDTPALYPETLAEAGKHTLLAAWNSDDDWRWEDHTRALYPYFHKMVTTYRSIYEANRAAYPNLVLSQWACVGSYDGLKREKDLPISFVGLSYGQRAAQVAALRRVGRVVAYGTGFGGKEGDDGAAVWKLRRRVAAALRLPLAEQPLAFSEINEIWNRTRISFTPLEASRPGYLQVKSRVFDMGLSGTMMLCTRNLALDEFYQRGTEYEDYANMEEACDKARHYLNNESARSRIAKAYYERTRREHLWEHRWAALFRDLGLPAG